MLFDYTRRHGAWIALFYLLLATTSVIADDTPCIVHDNGKIYDLNTLKSKKDYEIVTGKGRKLYLNVCQSVKTETFGLKDDASEIGAFIRRDHSDFSIGKFNTSISVFNSDARFTMAQGSQCTNENSNSHASSLVNFICDSSVSGPGSPQLIGSLPPGDEDAACAFIIEWKTPYACGISESGGFWKFFTALIVTLLILLALYTILGTLYNHFVLNLTGLDSIPQFSLQSMSYHISEAVEWTKDVLGILLVNYCTGGGGEGGRGYGILPSHNDNARTPNPVSHQAQVFGIVNGGREPHDEQDRDLDQDQTGGSLFTRPKPTQQQQRPTTNPVSHHTQTAVQSLSQTALPPQPEAHTSQLRSQPQTSTTLVPPTTSIVPQPQHPTQPPTRPFSSSTTIAPSTQEERQFMLFSTDEQEEQDQDQEGDGEGEGHQAGEKSKAPAIQL